MAPTPSTETRAVVQRYVIAVGERDERTIRSLFADDATWQLHGELPFSGTWTGRDAVIDEFLAGALAFYEPGSIGLEITGLVVEGEHAVVEWTSRARTRAGEPYENACIGVFTVRGGRIHAVREYMDTAYAHRVAFAAAG
jgi:hypothetical protein